ncbi:MAG: addiction module protein [Polyangiaceae bacterium]|nr:addiction module protein [Polyangiaceae bacterium]
MSDEVPLPRGFGRAHEGFACYFQVMARTAEAIIDEVLALPDGERARVLDALFDAVTASELEQDPAFMGELRHRADEALAGTTEGRPWRDVIGELRAELKVAHWKRRPMYWADRL